MSTANYIENFFYSQGIAPAEEQDFNKIDRTIKISDFTGRIDRNEHFEKYFGIHRKNNHCLVVCLFLQKDKDGLPKSKDAKHLVVVICCIEQFDSDDFHHVLTPFSDLPRPIVSESRTIVEAVTNAGEMFRYKLAFLQTHLAYCRSKNTIR